MKLTLTALQAALREYVTPDMANAMPGALATLRGDTVRGSSELEDHEVGGMILRALTSLVAPPELALQWVSIETAAEKVRLTPAEAAEHPLLQNWLEASLADALSRPIIAGARRHDLSPLSPAIDSVSILTSLEGCTAVTYSRFGTREGDAQVVARYGADLSPPAFTTTVAMTGLALTRVGRAARATSELHPAPEPREEPAPVTVMLQAAGTLH